ncbi:EndoU domain-containing protein [Actinobaculum sp. 352]|nr:EndoU domain-containing protein [Actinobaculum sp. 352]
MSEIPGGWPSDVPPLRVREWNHILYGDKRGGGHLTGYGWTHDRPEFPADWTPQVIRDATETVLRENPLIHRGGPVYRSDGTVNGVSLLVYVTRKQGNLYISGVFPT